MKTAERVKTKTASPRSVVITQRVIAIVVLLGVWVALVAVNLAPSMTPTPWAVVASIGATLFSSYFWVALLQTVSASLAGWLIAAVIGIVLGLIIGSLPPLERATSAVVDFGRSFPMIALLPVVILFLGANISMEIFMVTISCLWPVLIQTIYGTRRVEAALSDTARVFRIPLMLRFRRVYLPSASPFIATGLRISASIAVLVAVSTEVLSQNPGLGRQITLAQETQSWDVAFAYLFFTGMLGWGLAAGLNRLETRLLAWSRRSGAA